MRNQKGITLVALVITIIVLLILAGVSISLVIGQNGVLNQASNAVVTNKASGVKEKVSTALASAETTYYAKWAQNSSTQRANIYDTSATPSGASQTNDTGYEGVVFEELSANYGAANVTISGSLVSNSAPANANIIIKDGSDTFSFKVYVTSNGVANIDPNISVSVGGGAAQTITLN